MSVSSRFEFTASLSTACVNMETSSLSPATSGAVSTQLNGPVGSLNVHSHWQGLSTEAKQEWA